MSGREQQDGYRMPPPEIAALADAPPPPEVRVDPNNRWLLILQPSGLPPVSDLAQPELRLAGLRFSPRTNGPTRRDYYSRMSLKLISDLTERPLTGLPEGARVGSVRWSPDGKRFAFTVTGETSIGLWMVEADSAEATVLPGVTLNAAAGTPFCWMPDSRSLICRTVPTDRADPPEAPAEPAGPVIEENAGKIAPSRTYQDLLKNPHDEALFEYYLAAQAVRVTIERKVTPIGAEGLVLAAIPSPDGKYILAETLHRPFSYLVPFARFPRRVEILDLDGKIVRCVADLPLAEEIPIAFDAVRTGPRAFSWRADVPATLCWVEAQDGGDPKVEAEVRDRAYTLAAPFDGDPELLASLGWRFSRVLWSGDALALVYERWWKTRGVRTWVIRPAESERDPALLFDYSWQDRYNDPGFPLMKPTPQGTSVLLTVDGDGGLFLAGAGASPEGDRPFLDRLDLSTAKTKRLWRSEPPYYEKPVLLMDGESHTLLTTRESQAEPPNYFLRDLKTGETSQLTHFPHPTPQLAEVHKEIIRYDRADGVHLTAKLYLPPGHKPEDGPLPLLLWAYPREYKNADNAGQVKDSPCRFVRVPPGSPLFWLVHGYAVLEGPDMPIVGEGDEQPNNTYVEQLAASAQAAVDEVVRRGVADRNRIAVGGHSYGAFMAANLLVHTDLFCAGIARSGAYNRSLTPFGFQQEERTLWQALNIYMKMSPFMHVDDIKAPLLLIHGEADNNSGTFPIQSERLYNALKGHGAVTRLVKLPFESHGYRARESIMHVLWEMTAWLDKYAKNRRTPDTHTE